MKLIEDLKIKLRYDVPYWADCNLGKLLFCGLIVYVLIIAFCEYKSYKQRTTLQDTIITVLMPSCSCK